MKQSDSHRAGIRLPKVTRIALGSFDLYARDPDAIVDLSTPVTCIIGANGLGKSTFLNALLYGITGGIPTRSKTYRSASDYCAKATESGRVSAYFGGRVSEDMRGLASITIDLKWPESTIRLTRQFFDVGAIFDLQEKASDDECFSHVKRDDYEESDSVYRAHIEKLSGLKFDDFCFLWHFIITFDEERDLILWNSEVFTDALYLAFGATPEDFRESSRLRADVEKYSSKARNARFAAKQYQDEASYLQQTVLGGDPSGEVSREVRNEYEALVERETDLEERVRRQENTLADVQAQISDLSASLTEMQLEYDSTYQSRLSDAQISRYHPLVRHSLTSNQCSVCKTAGAKKALQARLDQHECPLCGSETQSRPVSRETLEKLKEIDSQILKKEKALKQELQKKQRLEDDIRVSNSDLDASRAALEDFLRGNSEASNLQKVTDAPETVRERIRESHSKAKDLDRKRREFYDRRDQARKELLSLERRLQSNYEKESKEFTDIFRQYAEQFIGLPVDFYLSHHSGINDTGFSAMLSLEGQHRADANSVSESQRFFLDIALRMALVQYLCQGAGVLVVDTPEGSLDISYEAQAGQMFAAFSDAGNQLICTANLNTSQLVLTMAKECRRAGMNLAKMTEWAELSDVQEREEELFLEAYRRIEGALN